MPSQVTLREVGPRDGLQVERYLPTEQKIALVNALSKTGLTCIEVTSFMHPKAMPNLADAELVMAGIDRLPSITYSGMVPNARGAARAVASRVDDMMFVFSASETANRRNVNMNVEESLRALEEILGMSRAAGVPVGVAIAMAFGCPFEGDVPAHRILDLVGRLSSLGVQAIDLADTTGMANPKQVYELSCRVLDAFPRIQVGLHIHNTRGAGMANLLAGLLAGVTRFDGSIGGLGGCPFAVGATGNVPTEDVAHMLQEMGIDTGLDLGKLIACAQLAQELIGRELPGQVMKAGVRGRLTALGVQGDAR
ncbi:MAG: hydroxymethylglutaryl-CoA lyase [Desulfobacca sp. RBG_16_60_12]|nr:MAG: hydroxymethylglutaryl-CoA lyase [Desulfobacca sp. RBG_16_60_12]